MSSFTLLHKKLFSGNTPKKHKRTKLIFLKEFLSFPIYFNKNKFCRIPLFPVPPPICFEKLFFTGLTRFTYTVHIH